MFTFTAEAKVLPFREINAIVQKLERIDRQLCKRLIFPSYNDRYYVYDQLVEYRRGIKLFLAQVKHDTLPDVLSPINSICEHNGPDFLQLYIDCDEFNTTFRYAPGEQTQVLEQLTAIDDAWNIIRRKLCPSEYDKELYEDPPLKETNATLEYGHH